MDRGSNIRRYQVVALSVTHWFNKFGDHDHNGLLYALTENEGKINEFLNHARQTKNDAQKIDHIYYNLMRPLVLRACVGETVKIKFKNRISGRQVGMHLISDGYDLRSDGAHVGQNRSSLANYDQEVEYTWHCHFEGTFVFHDAGNLSGMQDGTNLHGLFGALIVEPANTTWRDPETGLYATSGLQGAWQGDGLYVDIIPDNRRDIPENEKTPWLAEPVKYPEGVPGDPQKLSRCFREYVVFFHDEVEYEPSHSSHVPNICDGQPDICGHTHSHEHREHPLMTISYRAEPMVSRQQELWKRFLPGSDPLRASVVHEEQHHSSWMFGDPVTPLLKAYIGDPVRIRLIDAGVKETHVFHLHVYSWHHDPHNIDSPLIDAISFSPLTAHTIFPLWGAGNRQGATGDVIWHCHLYPHFHEGMWGMFRTFDRYQDGNQHYPDKTRIRRLLALPDRQTPTLPTEEDPGFPNFIAGIPGQRSPIPPWNNDQIPPGLDYRKPSTKELARLNSFVHHGRTEEHLNLIPRPGWMFNSFALPENGSTLTHTRPDEGDVITRFPETIPLSVETQRFRYNEHGWHDPEGHLYRQVEAPLILSTDTPPYVLTEAGKHDFRHLDGQGHEHDERFTDNTPATNILVVFIRWLLALLFGRVKHQPTQPTTPADTPGYTDKDIPLFIRANHGDVVTLELENRLPRQFCTSPFDESLPPCGAYTVPVRQDDGLHDDEAYWEADKTPPMPCGQHVHLVKFDPLVCDGASTGWNYLSGPRAPYYNPTKQKWQYLRMRYIWWVDEEFGVIFTHDHLFANFRQKRGLFGAMIAEPHGAIYLDPETHSESERTGDKKVIKFEQGGKEQYFREFCLGLGDFVPLYNRQNEALNPPPVPGHHSDHGVVGVNYHSAPIRERVFGAHEEMDMGGHGDRPDNHDVAAEGGATDEKRLDPAYVFSSAVWEDPKTPVFHAQPGDPIRIRLLQGSHEEQHSFQVHGMRWHRFSKDRNSPLRNQQTLGISEAFTFKIEHDYGPGDYLYKFGTSDDLWMGAWGIIRADTSLKPLPEGNRNNQETQRPAINTPSAKIRRLEIVAEEQEVIYCDSPALSDPKGLVFRLVSETSPQGAPTLNRTIFRQGAVTEPLIIRCRKHEWIELTLTNRLEGHLTIEPAAPMVPVEKLDRRVSDRVSLHADLLTYGVLHNDGCNVGYNNHIHQGVLHEQTAGVGESITYRWYADVEGPVLLQDMACFRHHRHHGLVGALIVEPVDAEVDYIAYPTDRATQSHVTVTYTPENQPTQETVTKTVHEIVLLIQDGLRLFQFGNLCLPMGDPPADPGEAGPDPTDQGQKGFNYRTQPVGKPKWLSIANPSTPVYELPTGELLKLHLVGACDKPRNHSFTLHGHTWKEWPSTGSPMRVGSATSVSTGMVETLEIRLASKPGDYAYRSGVLAWAVSQGLWGIIRLKESCLSNLVSSIRNLF